MPWRGLAAAAVLLAAGWLAGEPVRVETDSMLPTLRPGQWLWLDKIRFQLRGPERGEVVVVRDGARGRRFVKRVIGLPGERIDVVDEVVFVDGVPLPRRRLGPFEHAGQVFEAYEEQAGSRRYRVLDEPGRDTADARVELGPGEYWLLGDHRDRSEDGRSWGATPRARLLGPTLGGNGG